MYKRNTIQKSKVEDGMSSCISVRVSIYFITKLTSSLECRRACAEMEVEGEEEEEAESSTVERNDEADAQSDRMIVDAEVQTQVPDPGWKPPEEEVGRTVQVGYFV